MQNNAIHTQGLTKTYGNVPVVSAISLDAAQGAITSLLGPNGAGKSTTISMLAGLVKPGAGDAWVMGHSVTHESGACKALLGVVPQDIALYPDLTARENLVFWGKMYGLRGAALGKRADEVIETIELEDRKGRVGTFSGGMKRRVNIGIALMHRPQVLILDEPTVGIDPQSRRHILDSIKGLNREGMTVLYTTHYMEEAQELSHHISIMDQGKIIAQGTHDELVKLVGEMARVTLTLNAECAPLVEAWKTTAGVQRATADSTRVTLLVDDSNVVLPRLFESAAKFGMRITPVEIQEPNLETVFLHLTGRALRD